MILRGNTFLSKNLQKCCKKYIFCKGFARIWTNNGGKKNTKTQITQSQNTHGQITQPQTTQAQNTQDQNTQDWKNDTI